MSNDRTVVTAQLPSGKPLRVQVAAIDDGMGSVGLRDKLDVNGAIDTVGELGRLLYGKLQAIKPTRTSIELTLGFTVEAGKLTALIVNGKADASLTLTMEWLQETDD
jgi:Trypsin-co-occurring domain 1